MAEERHVGDTLFFVAEGDFRLYKADCSDFLNLTKQRIPMVGQQLWQQAEQSEGATFTSLDSSARRGSAPVALGEHIASTRAEERVRRAQRRDCTREV